VCTAALVDVGFQGPCSANGETCFDRYAAHAGMAVGAIFIIISACYTMFLTYMCYRLQTRRNERHVQLQLKKSFQTSDMKIDTTLWPGGVPPINLSCNTLPWLNIRGLKLNSPILSPKLNCMTLFPFCSNSNLVLGSLNRAVYDR
jgi:hypothetical protein